MPVGHLRRVGTVSVPSGTSGTADISLGAPYGRVLNFTVDATTDTSTTIELKDANGVIFYKDAATKNYTTKTYRNVAYDDTTTGLGIVPVDATGAALAAGQVVPAPVIKSPVTVTWASVTSPDSCDIELFVDITP